jgi:DNA-binding MarR family transcriptional regulator
MWERIKQFFTGSADELFEGLDTLLSEIDSTQFTSITGLKTLEIHTKNDTSTESGMEASSSLGLWPTPDLKASLSAKDSTTQSSERDQTYSDILMREFSIKDYIARLKTLLNRISVNHLYIFVDDFSELPKDAMEIVVNTLLAPLNNWSDELIKFKVAAYPGMVYYGNIDKTKIDEINLDLYKLYGTSDFNSMEKKAIEFTRRLVERRIKYYCTADASIFMEAKYEDVWRDLFYATMANPRNLGYVLLYLYESHLLYDRIIGPLAIRDAARRYYEEKIESYFEMNKFLQVSFVERSSIMSLKELLDDIVDRARELRRYQKSEMIQGISGRPPTSHFHVVSEFEILLSTLELNFFLTKYYEMRDRDGRKVSVFALNYGLCQKSSISFGRPSGKTEYRLYFVERVFDYTPILEHYLKVNQEIKCDNCHHVYSFSDLSALKMFQMKCPNCNTGTCQVTNLSKKYEAVLRSIDMELLLPQTELGILQTLKMEKEAMYASEIAADLDCSYQLVGKRGKFLAERGLVDRKMNEEGRRQFEITKTAKKLYFTDSVLEEPDQNG